MAKLPNEMWRVPRAAEYLGRSEGAIYWMVSQGLIPHIKLGRVLYFDPAELAGWIEAARRPAIRGAAE